MPTIASALDTAFTPATGSFVAQASGAIVVLECRQTAGAAWVQVAVFDMAESMIVDNPIAGVQYRFRQTGSGTAAVQADQ